AALWGAGWEIHYAVQRARARAEQRRIAEQQREPPPPLKAEPAPAPEPQKQPEVRKPPPPPPPVKVARAPEPIEVKLNARFGAHVTLDDRDLGNATQFPVKVVPGAHRVVVRHPCCAELAQELQISPKKEVYPLEYGPPKPAEFKVLNAPAGARLLVDGVVVG